jgi:hypothetical protein
VTSLQLIGGLAEAIAHFEGFFRRKSRAQRNNNPGNLRKWGTFPLEAGYVKFPAGSDLGWKALDAQIARNMERGVTLYEFFAGQRDASGAVLPDGYAGYAPAEDRNRPSEYAAYVASFVKKNYGWDLKRDMALKAQVNG